MFRVGVVKMIRDALMKTGHFDAYDFIIEQTEREADENGDASSYLLIKYAYDERFFFQIRYFHNSREGLAVTMAPGRTNDCEFTTVDNVYSSLKTIEDWTEILFDDLSSSPMLREIANHADILAAMEKQLNDLPDQYFTRSEAHELKERLSHVEKEIIERYNDEREESQAELEKVKKEVQKLKSQVDILTKKNWFKSFVAKTTSWTRNNPAFLGQIANETLQMLPEDIKKRYGLEEAGNVLVAVTKRLDGKRDSEVSDESE